MVVRKGVVFMLNKCNHKTFYQKQKSMFSFTKFWQLEAGDWRLNGEKLFTKSQFIFFPNKKRRHLQAIAGAFVFILFSSISLCYIKAWVDGIEAFRIHFICCKSEALAEIIKTNKGTKTIDSSRC